MTLADRLLFLLPIAAGCTAILGGDYQAVEEPGAGGTPSAGGGGQGTGGGVGGVGNDGGVGGTGGSPLAACPAGLPGPAMVLMSSSTTPYCIDNTEVTRDHYRLFVEEDVLPQSVSGEPPECEWNATYEPAAGYPYSQGELDRPAVNVDWCDAAAYCAWAGKRLCGRFGGGPLDPSGAADPTESEWFNVCTNGGRTNYPYGAAFEAMSCNGLDTGLGLTADVGAFTDCHGDDPPFSLVFDLSGNASEWENSCTSDGTTPNADNCLRRGGAYTDNQANLRCGQITGGARDAHSISLSFRCCADAR